MDRRRFIAAAGAVPLLAACDADGPPEAPLALGPLEPRRTLVKDGLDLYFLVSDAAGPGAPAAASPAESPQLEMALR